MFEQVREEVLGMVENMSFLDCPHCGKRIDVFNHGGGRRTAEAMKIPFLAEIPLDPETRLGGDTGKPVASLEEPNPQASAFEKLALKVVERANESKQKARPTIEVSD
jgi:ATP-binding protein involved in chromosome partitioning